MAFRGSDPMERMLHEMQLFKDSIVKSMYAFMVDTKGAEKQMHGAYSVAGNKGTKLPTTLAIEISELEKLYDSWDGVPEQQELVTMKIKKLRRLASLFNLNPKSLVDVATSREEDVGQEVIPPVSGDLDELVRKTMMGTQ